MQPSGRSALVMYSRRHGDQRRSKSERGGVRELSGAAAVERLLSLPVDEILQFLAGLEVGHLLRRHVHLVARLRVAPLARLALAQAEAPEPAQLDLLTAVQRLDDALEYRVDDDFGVLLREIGDAGHCLHELRLRHAAARNIHDAPSGSLKASGYHVGSRRPSGLRLSVLEM